MKACPLGWLTAATLTPLLVSSNAFATAFGFSDLNITGSVELTTLDSTGNVAQTGEIRTTLSGATTTSTFSTTIAGANPLAGDLTASGDGVGYSTQLRAIESAMGIIEYNFITDFAIDMMNASLSNTYTISFELDYDHRVEATGDDAYAESKLDVEEDTVDIFLNEVVSDTRFVPGPDADSGLHAFDVIVAAGSTVMLTGNHQWEGGIFEPGTSDVDILVDLTLVGVTCQGQDCVVRPVPEPGMAGLLVSALTGIAWLRRRRLPGAAA